MLSDEVRKTAKLRFDGVREQEITIRGRAEPMIVRAVADAKTLSSLTEGDETVAA